jgi:hypothetical protein
MKIGTFKSRANFRSIAKKKKKKTRQISKNPLKLEFNCLKNKMKNVPTLVSTLASSATTQSLYHPTHHITW